MYVALKKRESDSPVAADPDERERGREGERSGAPRRIRITIAVAAAAPFCASDKAPLGEEVKLNVKRAEVIKEGRRRRKAQ